MQKLHYDTHSLQAEEFMWKEGGIFIDFRDGEQDHDPLRLIRRALLRSSRVS